jgi:hypothetical protein
MDSVNWLSRGGAGAQRRTGPGGIGWENRMLRGKYWRELSDPSHVNNRRIEKYYQDSINRIDAPERHFVLRAQAASPQGYYGFLGVDAAPLWPWMLNF